MIKTSRNIDDVDGLVWTLLVFESQRLALIRVELKNDLLFIDAELAVHVVAPGVHLPFRRQDACKGITASNP